MSIEKIQELARDIAREQYTDDPDDPHWSEDEDEDPYDNYCLRHADDDEFDDTPRNPGERYPGVVTYPFS